MRWITLLLLMALIGGVSADSISADQMTRNQFIFMNSPSDETFSTYAQKYWDNYILSQPTDTPVTVGKKPNITMTIWMNQFPITFQKPVELSATTFSTGGRGSQGINPAVWNSLMLERQTVNNFGMDNSWVYSPSPISTSFAMLNTARANDSRSSQGLIISQNILTLFGA